MPHDEKVISLTPTMQVKIRQSIPAEIFAADFSWERKELGTVIKRKYLKFETFIFNGFLYECKAWTITKKHGENTRL